MGIKRCPSFSKRPGFPCGLRVLLIDAHAEQRCESEELLKECSYEVTPCSSAQEALARLDGACSFDVLLADKPTLSGSSREARELLDLSSGVPCILMAATPTPEDVMAGVELGAVDFLAKPLAPLKLRNIWQHTVRKLMCNMSISCSDAAAAAGEEGLLPPLPCGKERVSMEIIMEEMEEAEEAAAAAAAAAAGHKDGTTPRSSTSSPQPSVINYGNAPNPALAITSSFYAPSGAGSASSAQTGGGSSEAGRCSSPGSPDSRPAKQQHCSHGPVRSCPSTRSLSSLASCQSNWQASLPASPSSLSLARQGSTAGTAAAAATAEDSGADEAGRQAGARCMRKAVRHPAPAGPPAASASKPPLCGKPAGAQGPPAMGTPATGVPAARAQEQVVPAAPCTSSGGLPAGAFASVPLPTGLGPLPQGMVWGMPMCPLVRAPGIVPPASATSSMPLGLSCAAQAPVMPPPMPAWGMCGMPAMFGAVPPPPFMTSYGSMMPHMGYAGVAPCAAGTPSYPMMAAGMPCMDAGAVLSCGPHPAAAQQQQPQDGDVSLCQPAGPCTRSLAAAAAGVPTGAAAAAALGGIDLLGCGGSDSAAAGSAAMADDDDAFDFVLGDIAAEDDITHVCGSLLDADLSGLEHGGLHLPAQVTREMQALEADLQQQQQAAAAAAAGRSSIDCGSMRTRVSFDCSSASTCTAAARASFETCARGGGGGNSGAASGRVSFEVSTISRCNSSRPSFEVSHAGVPAPPSLAPAAPAAVAAASAAAAQMASAASAPATLLGSMSDLFAACCDDSSQGSGSGLHHVDSCGMLADLQSLFGASGDSASPADCADSAAADGSELFVDMEGLDEMPLGAALRKSSSLAELLNAGLPPATLAN